MNERRVIISGMGCITPFGVGVDSFWTNLVSGNTAAKLIDTFDVSGLPTRFAATVPLSDAELNAGINDQKSLKTMSRAIKYAMISTQQAVNDSNLVTSGLDPYRFGVSLGAGGLGLWDLQYSNQMMQIVVDSIEEDEKLHLDFGKVWKNTLNNVHPLTPLKALPNMAAAHIAIKYNARGHCQTISTACTSAAQAIGEAYRIIKNGISDVMISGGSDSMINPNGLIAFSTLGVISKNNDEYRTAARPFDKRRDGFMIGEGAAVFILEDLAHCIERGGKPIAEIIGYASTCDAYRLTDEPREAWGATEAIKRVLQEAKIEAQNVDYINAHGTGTLMNDVGETNAIKNVFDKFAYKIPISSTKSMIGHLVAAAGAVELLACIQSMQTQTIHPTINYQLPDPECDLNYVPNNSMKKSLNVVLSNSFGFGGQNACLLIKNYH